MEATNFLATFLILLNFNCQTNCTDPETQLDYFTPETYILKLYVDLYQNYPHYLGSVHITISCVKSTSEIVFQANYLEIFDADIEVTLLLQNPRSFQNLEIEDTYSGKQDQYIIKMATELTKGNRYQVCILFKKNLTGDMTELFTSESALVEVMKKFAITRTGAEARSAFPCFDNEHSKAKFKLFIGYLSSENTSYSNQQIYFKALSNMPISRSKPIPTKELWIMDEFPLSPPLTTREIFIDLVSFDPSESIYVKTLSSKIPVQVWANVALSKIQFALDVACDSLEFYSQYFNFPYESRELDLQVIPDSEVAGHENQNYSVVVIKETSAIYPNEDIETSKFDVALRVCHLIAHQWVDTESTLSFLAENWVSEGLSIFLEVPCVDQVLEDDKIDYLNVISTQRFITEMRRGTNGAHRSEIDSSSDTSLALSTEKAFFLIGLINFALGSHIFKESLNLYLENLKKGKTDLNPIWDNFEKAAKKYNVLPDNLTIKNIITSWNSNQDYPIINVTINENKNMITIHQKPFSRSIEEKDTTSPEKYFWIPLSYTTKSDHNTNHKLEEWLSYRGLEIPIKKLDEEEWILLTLNINALCLTNYQEKNWKLIQNTLLDEKEFILIEEMARVRLIHDMFHLPRAGVLKYNSIFETLQYLKFEDSQAVWVVVREELLRIRSNLLGTDLFNLYKNYIRDILAVVFEKNQLSSPEKDWLKDNVKYSLMRIIFELSCIFDIKGCIEVSEGIFYYATTVITLEQIKLIPVSIRDVVLCYGVKNQDVDPWGVLHQYYKIPGIPNIIKKDILIAMGCPEGEDILKNYLDWSMYEGHLSPVDRFIAYQSLSANEFGYSVMMDFVLENYNKIEEFAVDDGTVDLSNYLATLLEATTTQNDLNKLTDFMKRIENPNMLELLQAKIEQATRNINFVNDIRGTFGQIFPREFALTD